MDTAAEDPKAQPEGGLTLARLQEIGAEAGIGAACIEEAVVSLESPRRGPLAGSVLGVPTTMQQERVLPMRLEPELLPELLDLIRNEFSSGVL